MTKSCSQWICSALICISLIFIVVACSQPSEVASNKSSSSNLEKAQDSDETSLFSTESEIFAKGRILVQPKVDVGDLEVGELLSAHGGKVKSKIEGINVYIVELPENANEKAIAALLAHNPKFNFAEVDSVVTAVQLTDDPLYANQWHLPKINAPSAWDLSTGAGVTIAILDTGVDGTHPDLAARMVPGFNTYDNNTNTADVEGHGTMCAGTAAAIGNNSVGTTGVAWNANIMPIRISDRRARGYSSTIAAGITWAGDHGAKIASISFGPLNGSSTVISAAQYFQGKGGVVLNSGGNSGVLESYANTEYMITVAATDPNDARTSWSTYGNFIDITAPGLEIWTTTRGGGYSNPSGTSFSCPLTAGVVALMFSINPTLSPIQIQNILSSTSVDLGSLGWDQYYGQGRVDANAAVILARDTVGSDDQAPTALITSPVNGANLSGIVTVNVTATDNVAVTRVDLYWGGVLVGSISEAPYSFSLDSLGYADGAYHLVAQAVDANGNIGSSNPVSVTVDNVVDSVAPEVTINNPANNATVKGNVTINATATDNESVKSMSILIDGVIKANSTSGSISYSWNTSKIAAGTHTIQVNAVDASGNVGTKIIQVKK